MCVCYFKCYISSMLRCVVQPNFYRSIKDVGVVYEMFIDL